MRTNHLVAELALVLATLLWGGTFAVLKVGLNDISPFLLVAIRFSISSFLFLPLLTVMRKEKLRGAIQYGLFLGFIMFFAYGLQTMGLETTSPSRSAFLTQMLILFTPALEFLIAKLAPGKGNLIGIALVIPGLYFLMEPEKGGGYRFGDLLTLGCAFAFAFYIVILGIATHKYDLVPLMFFQTLGVAGFSWIYVLFFEEIRFKPEESLFLALLYLSPFATNLTVYLQSRFQKVTGSVRASIIYTMEPVFATLIAVSLFEDRLSLRESLGAILIVIGLLVGPLFSMLKKKGGSPVRSHPP